MGLPKGDQLLMKLPKCPPTAPPPPPRRRWSSYTKREIERFWRKKRSDEEEHFLAAIKAAARLRATHFSVLIPMIYVLINYKTCFNNLRVTALKFSMYVNLRLNVYFLRVITIKYQNLQVQTKTHSDHFGGRNCMYYVFLA